MFFRSNLDSCKIILLRRIYLFLFHYSLFNIIIHWSTSERATHFILYFFKFSLGIPSLIEFFDIQKILLIILYHIFVLWKQVDYIWFLTDYFTNCSSRLRFGSRETIWKCSDISFNQILNTFWDLDFISIIFEHAYLLLKIFDWINWMSKFESTFLFLFENGRTNHELLRSLLDLIHLLFIKTRSLG